MDDLQTIFEGCQRLYKECYDNLRKMSCIIARYMEAINQDWNPRLTTLKFDIVLQYSLLQIAVSDFDFDQNEVIFIRDLTEQGDYVQYINSIAHTNFTWDDFYNTRVCDIRKILRDTKNLMLDLSEEFITVFALCDKFTEYDYVANLEKNITLIILGLSKMDSEITESEMNEDCLIFATIDRIKELLQK